ncbi:MAG: DUF3854 domain-containing protein [Candidatus Polarisedimenticolia bacterium]
MKAYVRPGIHDSRRLLPEHREQLEASAIDLETALFGAVYSIAHQEAYALGMRGDVLDGLAFPYWVPSEQRFSSRMLRVRLDIEQVDKKYLQPIGERARLYFIAGTTAAQLADTSLPVLMTEGEKKSLALHRALNELDIAGLVIGLGGVWGWRWSPKELQPDGKLGKGRSRPSEELDLIAWKGRIVYVIFDSDVESNPKVTTAESALAREFHSRGAKVHLVRVPGGEAACLK